MVVNFGAIVHPPAAEPLVLEKEFYLRCGTRLCVSTAQAKARIRNKIKISGWMFKTSNAVAYYRSLGNPDPFRE